MLKNISYNNLNVIDEINKLVGKPYSFLEKIKRGGVGSKKLLITKAAKPAVSWLPSRPPKIKI